MENIKSTSLRLLSVVLAIAVLFSFSAVMFSISASAEEQAASSSDVTLDNGILGKYQCIRFRYTDEISCQTLYDKFMALGTDYVYGEVFGYKDGKFFTYTNNGIAFDKNSSNLTIQFNGASFFGVWLEKEYLKTARFCLTESNGHVVSTYKYLNKDGDYSNGNLVTLARNSTLSEFASLYGDTFYAIFTGSNSAISTDTMKAFESDVINGYKDKDFITANDASSPKAEFMTCYSYEVADGMIPLWLKDFTSEGQQYPLFTYYIHDNGNKHSYSLKLSYSSQAKETVKKVFNLTENEDEKYKDLYTDVNNLLKYGGCKMTDLSKYVQLYKSLLLPQNLSYNLAFNLNSAEMDFSSTGDNKIYTICLSDYSDILQDLVYKAEIIDNTTGFILDTTYFASRKSYYHSNSGFGSKVYDYGDDYDGMLEDIKNDTPRVEPDKKDSFVTDGDVINTEKHDYFSNLNISDIFGSLENSASSLQAFFNACMSIIPAGILAIVLGGLSICIVLRILGR